MAASHRAAPGLVAHSLHRTFALRLAAMAAWPALACGQAESPPVTTPAAAALLRLSIEELAQVEISSVSRHAERVADAAAAVYVITPDLIRRSGATTLAEALRLAPNLNVARVNSSTWAISARGFNGTTANKLLVMIDGRTVYTPLHAGVFWDMHDVVLEDVERIEVVSGPGGTLWGANAVNGVINVITRPAREAVGTFVEPVVGTEERGLVVRQGWRTGPDTGLRIYAKALEFDSTQRADGSTVADGWRHAQTGFRWGTGTPMQGWTVQGDAFDGRADVPGQPERRVRGGNLLARWRHDMGERGNVRLQAWVDTYRREQPGFFTEQLDTLDVDFQHRVPWGERHDFVWGAGLRHHHDHTSAGALLRFDPSDSTMTLASVFAQDTVALSEAWKFTLGLKLERTRYTGTESQPSVRLAWKPNDRSLLWTAVSRAVRTPSRLDRDLFVASLPPPYGGRLLGGPDFVSESLKAWEAGWRAWPTTRLGYSINVFVNRYDRLRSVEPTGTGDFVLGNRMRGRGRGMEAWGDYQASENWRLHAGSMLLRQRLRFADESADPGSTAAAGNDPRHQWMLRSSWTLPRDMLFDVAVRRVGPLPSPAVPGYTALDARIAWSPRRDVELSIAGFDLLDAQHPEFGAAPARSEIGRRLILRAIWSR